PATPASVPRVQVRGGLLGRLHEPSGVEEVIVVTGHAVEVLAHQRQAQVAGEAAGPVAVAAGVGGHTPVTLGVEHGGRQFAVMGPGPAVEVGATDARPRVVHD